eukprot:TRINITY_DN6721_c5_g1_i1.p1 TRINITY_DN6721_c5_g1~~TRINITY_DN6721_c5_g1_i1.p1  ORF type:complete len:522 (+),score=129.77 TRINITY_DN6721_c5_g1_i1:58-1623(+)
MTRNQLEMSPYNSPAQVYEPVPPAESSLWWGEHPEVVSNEGASSPGGGLFHTRGRMRPGDHEENQRWLMLFLLSYGSAMNQAVCFSFAPFASIAALRYGEGVIAQSEVIYFLVYIPMSFVGSYVVDKYGLRTGMVAACGFQTLGTWIRWTAHLFLSYERHVIFFGQFVASIGMCIFVNSPPRLSTAWFPPQQRTLSTNIAVNANAAGAAMAYFFGPLVVATTDDFPLYNLILAISCTTCLTLVVTFFRSHPDWHSPDVRTEYDWSQWTTVFKNRGFVTTLFVFAVSECVINTMSTLLAQLVRPNGFTRNEAGYLGAEFLLVCMLGGAIFGAYPHKWSLHRNLAKCMIACGLSMVALKMMLSYPHSNQAIAIPTVVFFAGLFLGPLQATCNELGVECAFPVSENTVAALQQLVGNLVSALFIPFITYFHDVHAEKTGPVGTVGHVGDWYYWWTMPEIVIAGLLFVSAMLLFAYRGAYRRLTMEYEVLSICSEDILSRMDEVTPLLHEVPPFKHRKKHSQFLV